MLDDKVPSMIFDSEKKDAEDSFFKYKIFSPCYEFLSYSQESNTLCLNNRRCKKFKTL